MIFLFGFQIFLHIILYSGKFFLIKTNNLKREMLMFEIHKVKVELVWIQLLLISLTFNIYLEIHILQVMKFSK